MRSSTDDILLPDFAKAVFFEPGLQLFHVGPRKLRFSAYTIHHNDIFRIKVVKEGARLRANKHLSVVRCFLEQRRDHV